MRISVLMLILFFAVSVQARPEYKHTLPFVPSADSNYRGFVRIINLSPRVGRVFVHATDDTGERFGPVSFWLQPNQTKQFEARHLEEGQGLSGRRGLGDGKGHWWVELRTNLNIKSLAYVHNPNGLITYMHTVVQENEGAYFIPFFNPASNRAQRSILRLVNTSDKNDLIQITGRDTSGREGEGEWTTWLKAGESRTINATQIERQIGDGSGKWNLTVKTSFGTFRTKPIWVMNLLQTSTGHLSNLSVESNIPSKIAGPPAGTPPSAQLLLDNNFISERIHLTGGCTTETTTKTTV